MKPLMLIVSHDAGGAEVVSAWAQKHWDLYDFTFVLDGPAVSIFKRRLGPIVNYSKEEMKALIKKVDHVLTSTSWSSDIERIAITAAKEAGTVVSSYLDHWINYKERFLLEGSYCYPDEIWVGDDYAKAIAQNIFPNIKVCYYQNEYLREINERIETFLSQPSPEGLNILFLSQPIDRAAVSFKVKNNTPLTDRDIFEALKNNIEILKEKRPISELRIRLHPSDKAEKYLLWMSEIQGINILLSNQKDLLEDCMCSDWVVGTFSMALVIAYMTKRKVFSCLTERLPYTLPHEGIIDFKSYVESL